MGYDHFTFSIPVDKNGDILLRIAAVEQAVYVVNHADKSGFDFALCRLVQFLNADMAEVVPILFSNFLDDIGVDVLHAQHVGKNGEKCVVPLDYVAGTSPIGVRLYVVALRHDGLFWKIPINLFLQQSRVGVAEPVDTLFHVADNQAVVVACQTVDHERTHVFPLHLRCVLKLVDEEMFQPYADTFVNERCVVFADDFFEHFVCVRQHYKVVAGSKLADV